MFSPSKRLGDDDEKGGKKPAAAIMLFGPEKRLGDEEPEAEDSEPSDPDEVIVRAAEGICRICNVSSSKAKALGQYIETIARAADSKPHDEGEHEAEESEIESE